MANGEPLQSKIGERIAAQFRRLTGPGAIVVVFAILGVCTLLATIGGYVVLGRFRGPLSSNSGDWSNFGAYVGGVAGPFLSLLALLAVAWTVRLQYSLLQRDYERQQADQQTRWLDAIYQDIRELLDAPLASTSGYTTLRAALNGEVRDGIEGAVLNRRISELLKLLTQYCEAVALYRDNVSSFFDARIFADRGARLLDRLKPYLSLLDPAAAITIEFCDMHLRGVRERKRPEALHRSSRV